MKQLSARDSLVGDALRRQSNDPLAREADRIRSAYSRRVDASRYSIFEPAQLFALQERERIVLKVLASCGIASSLGETQILDVGCGTGYWIRQFVQWGAQPGNIVGVDLLPGRISDAKYLCPPGVTLLCQGASDLRNLPRSFDLVIQSTVFTSILDPLMKQQLASEMLRVLNPKGFIVWYDFYVNNPSNADVRGVKRKEILELFPGCHVRLRKLTLAPPLGRRIGRLSWTLYSAASAMKLLCTHYLGIIQKA